MLCGSYFFTPAQGRSSRLYTENRGVEYTLYKKFNFKTNDKNQYT